MSPIEAAATAIDIHNTAAKWNKALLDNSARPSGALVYSARDGNLTPEQYERLKSELESGFQGAHAAGRPMLLEGGLDWKSMSLSPKDMDFMEAKNAAAREIALAIGVPPVLLGIPGDATYANYQEANRAFYRQTVIPLSLRLARALTDWLGTSLSPSLRGEDARRAGEGQQHPPTFHLDLDSIEALSSEREALWARLGKTSFLTSDEKRAAIGYDGLPSSTRGIATKYRPDQARDEQGRWSDDDSGPDSADNTDAGSEPDKVELTPVAARGRGGFAKEVLKWTVQKFVSTYCEGKINKELPGQFEDMTIAEIIALAKSGDSAAKKCEKLLKQPRFRK